MSKFVYYTDGAATMINKNREYIREAGGWAFIRLIDGEISYKESGGCPLTTNNEMELYAIYASLRDFKDNSQMGDSIEISSDSAYSIDIFTKWIKNWISNGWKRSNGKAIKNSDLIKAIWDLIGDVGEENVSFKKVKGHSKNKLNNEVDQLAVLAKKHSKESQKTIGYNQKDDSLLGLKKEK